ncbi:MAG: response regulator [Actinomycetota bacterium]|nr:response regulator [Actinomycetota bacterium]
MAQDVVPDVARLDIEMPGATGLQAAETLSTAMPGCRILILATFGRPGYLRPTMESGASGSLLKDSPATSWPRPSAGPWPASGSPIRDSPRPPSHRANHR